MLRQAWIVGLLLVACGAAPGKKRADGTYLFDCSEHKRCFEAAGQTCGEQGYIVVGGKSNKQTYGTPGNEVRMGKDEIYVRCNRDRPADAPDAKSGSWNLERKDADKTTRTPAPKSTNEVAPKTVSQICRPGETQRCFGPGACEGGQSCMSDGSAFGPCDCGGPSASKPGSSAPSVSEDAPPAPSK